MAATSIVSYFADLPDPRSPLGRRHVLSDVLTIAICAVVCGADGWVQVQEFGEAKREWFATFLDLPHGIPSHDTFGRVFGVIDPDAFERCFGAWASALAGSPGGKLVSVDGKSIRRSFAHAWDKSGMAHLVSAFVGANRVVLGQLAVEGAGDDDGRRGNEITALPGLLDLLDLRGATVTADAMACQRAIAGEVLGRGADYVLAVKDNQPTLHERVRKLMTEAVLDHAKGGDATADGSDGSVRRGFAQAVDGDHGRVETRRVWVTDEVGCLGADLLGQWPGLRTAAAVERVREVIGGGPGGATRTEVERHYYISSLAGRDAARMGDALRGHWSVENQLHWHLDVSFGEDDCRIRKGHAAENFSRLRRIALNLLQRETTLRRGIKTKRLRAGWDRDYLLKVIGG